MPSPGRSCSPGGPRPSSSSAICIRASARQALRHSPDSFVKTTSYCRPPAHGATPVFALSCGRARGSAYTRRGNRGQRHYCHLAIRRRKLMRPNHRVHGELRMNNDSTSGSSGGVSYKQVGADYFQKRGLRRYAKVWSLWALGVGAVISGHYSGWNFGLANGFGSMLVALFIIAAMYWGLIFSLAEMSPALPHTGAAYSFARSAMGPWGGMFTGLAESIEYILTPAVIVFFIGSYMSAIFETPDAYQPAWWAASYLVFLALNLWGVELSFRVSVIVTLGALAILAIYWVSAIPSIDFNHWALNIDAGPDGT